MSNSKFKPGDIVRRHSHKFLPTNTIDTGTVLHYSSAQPYVLVEWNDSKNTITKSHPDTLMFLSDMTELELEFEDSKNAAAEKMKTAAALIKEAGQILESKGYDLGDVSETILITDALETYGWIPDDYR